MPCEIAAARTPGDWVAVRRLFEQYASGLGFDLGFQDFAGELESLPGCYAEPGGCVLLARVAGEPVGCVALRPLAGAVCEMKRLYVEEDRRRAGLGRRLARRILREASRRGYEAMRLDTVPSMGAARKLYESLGFGPIEPYRYNPVAGTIFMERRLGVAKAAAGSVGVGSGDDSP